MKYLENNQEFEQQNAETNNSESVENMADLFENEGGEQDGSEEIGQEKPKRKARKKKDTDLDGADIFPDEKFFDTGAQPDGDLFGELPDHAEENAEQSEKAGTLPEDSGSGDVTSDMPTRRSSSRRPTVLDGDGNAIYERIDTGQHDLSVLSAARNARRILSATVDGTETDGDALPRVVFYVGSVKVMIPFEQMGFDLDPKELSQREARLLIDSMLGAKIDYMIRGVDSESRLAGASRRDAMIMRQRTILNARGNNQPHRINEGMRVTTRIMHVSRNTVRVEVYGFESYVYIDDISNLWVNDIREVIHVGEERPVEIVSLERGEDGRVQSMRVSMKAAEDAPQMELRDGNTYTGYVSNFSTTAYYIRVAGIPLEIRCPIKSNYVMELMNVGDYVKFFVRGIYDGVPTGAILKIIKKKIAPNL